jgi:hypothetical protein
MCLEIDTIDKKLEVEKGDRERHPADDGKRWYRE